MASLPGVIPWGSEYLGGRLTSILPRRVVRVAATDSAFAAVRSDGTVITWGDAGAGGNSYKVQEQLKNVREMLGMTVLGPNWVKRKCIKILNDSIGAGIFQPSTVYLLGTHMVFVIFCG